MSDDLVKRLLAQDSRSGKGMFRYNRMYINPDGPEAATRIQELEAQVERLRWQPIETAPKNGERVILFTPPYGAGSGNWDAERGCWRSHFALIDHPPTHWMPLPEPPARQSTGDSNEG